MSKVAIIQFPGTNCEYETQRACRMAGLDAQLVRWNENFEEIRKFDAYILPGGFSYEDRVRSGAIAARDPIMSVIQEEAEKGKPVLGICNGAQMLVEAGMIPGLKSASFRDVDKRDVPRLSALQAALAANDHGWLNIWVSITNDAEPGRTPFNNYPKGHHFRLPIAHGEGRFVIPEDTLKQLITNGQTVFRYCDGQGQIKNEFPVNPNGAVYNLAGVCDPAGNVLALMPHPERVKEGQIIFESLRKYLVSKSQFRVLPREIPRSSASTDVTENKLLKIYSPPDNAIEFYINLIISDNEAVTLENALHQMGCASVKVAKKTHWELTIDANQHDMNNANLRDLIDNSIASGELLNTNKETPSLRVDNKWYSYRNNELHETAPALNDAHKNLLVRYNDDYDGAGKLLTLHELGFEEIQAVKKGIVWQIEAAPEEWEMIQEMNILFNPYSQLAYNLSYG